MAAGKEIRNKIRSVQNTQKITKAMEMVAASKMRKAQERMRAARPYAEKIRKVAAHLSQAHPEYKHPAMEKRDDVKRIGIIVVSTDKGLCGGLNTNILRLTTTLLKENEAKGIQADICTIGNKAFGFIQRNGGNVVAHEVGLGDTPHLERIVGPVKVLLDAYLEGKIDRVVLCYNKFINTMKQEPLVEQLLPLTGEKMEDRHAQWDYLYEPDAKSVIDDLVTRYIEALVYQAVVENIACEQSARMVAMKAASDNAGTLIEELKLVYNKTRQAAITKELSEIVAGAAAV